MLNKKQSAVGKKDGVVNPGVIAFSDIDGVNSTRRRSNVHEVHNPILVRKMPGNEQLLLGLPLS